MPDTPSITVDAAATDRFYFWQRQMMNIIAPMRICSSNKRDFSGVINYFSMGQAFAWSTIFPPAHLTRTAKDIERLDPRAYHLIIPLRGRAAVRQGSKDAIFEPYEMHLIDTSRSYDCRWICEKGEIELVGFGIPKILAPMPEENISQILTVGISRRDGIGSLVSSFVTKLTRESAHYRSSDRPRLEAVLVELFTALLAHALETCTDIRISVDGRDQSLMLRIKSYLLCHLADSGMTPTTVAAAHHISVSYLHRIFQRHNSGFTVASWIRHQRLERARKDLGDPSQQEVPVQEIAARWGFSYHAAFTRSFRTAYGLPPRDYRKMVHAENRPSSTASLL